MNDFQFGAEQDTELGAANSQLPHVYKLNPFLEQENKTGLPLLPAGGSIGAKPILHIGEPIYKTPAGMGDHLHTVVYKTPEGGEVNYNYTAGKPDFASKHDLEGNFIGHFTPEHIEFPAAEAPKSTLHVEEPQEVFPFSTKAKTADGGTVYYDYHEDGKPMGGQLYDQAGNFQKGFDDKTIEFPVYKPGPEAEETAKASKALDQLQEEITNLLGPEKPTLHVGGPQNYSEGYHDPSVIKYKTSSGGFVDYHYTEEGKPIFASEHPTNSYVDPGVHHQPEDINFPVHPSFTQKPWEPNLSTVHDTYSTAFAHYKNFDDDKPELEFAGPLKNVNPGMAQGKLSNGNYVQVHYTTDGPYQAVEFDAKGNALVLHSNEDINLPQHPSETSKPHAESITDSLDKAGWTPGTQSQHPWHDPEYNNKIYVDSTGGWKIYPNDGSGNLIAEGSTLHELQPYLKSAEESEVEEPEYARSSYILPNYPALTLKEPLTDEEKRVASEYSGTYYEDLANYIYYEGSSHVEKQDIETLTKAIDKHPLQSDMTLYRGVAPEVFNKFALLRPGQSGWQTGFMSSRTDRPGARNWKGGKYHFVIETPAGTPGLPMETLSRNRGENEILFKPNTKLQMVKREGRTLYLKIVNPASDEQSLKYYSAYRTRDYTNDEFPWEYREYTEYAKSRFPEAFKSEADFREKYIEAPLIHLPEDTLKNLENSTVGSYFHAGMEKARKDFSHHRDIDRIEGQMVAGSMPPPIVLKYSGGYRVLGGNTRLSVGAARGYNIPVKLIDISDKY